MGNTAKHSQNIFVMLRVRITWPPGGGGGGRWGQSTLGGGGGGIFMF